MNRKKIAIGIVYNHTLFRSGLASLMKEFDEIDVVLEAKNGIDFQKEIKKNEQVLVVLMDINMPIMDGYATTRWIKSNYPHIHVLALSMPEDEKAIIAMLKSGAGGYVYKESRPLDLLAAIKIILEKGFYLNDLASDQVLPPMIRVDSSVPYNGKELTFLQLCCSDLTYKEIANIMNLSPRTIDNYRERLFIRLGIKTRTGLVVQGIKNGLIKI